jgi:hypothetical protein
MANPSVLRQSVRRLSLLCVLAAFGILSGCALAQHYPAYRGKVLDLGTDKPIEGAGVVAVYRYNQIAVGASINPYLGYQAVLTNAEGRFEVPAKWFTKFTPMTSFDDDVRITIYKAGYGNFPGSFGEQRPKHGKTDPPLDRTMLLPPEKEVTFRLPKMETEEERKEHKLLLTGTGIPDSELPPKGMTLEQFRELFGRY